MFFFSRTSISIIFKIWLCRLPKPTWIAIAIFLGTHPVKNRCTPIYSKWLVYGAFPFLTRTKRKFTSAWLLTHLACLHAYASSINLPGLYVAITSADNYKSSTSTCIGGVEIERLWVLKNLRHMSNVAHKMIWLSLQSVCLCLPDHAETSESGHTMEERQAIRVCCWYTNNTCRVKSTYCRGSQLCIKTGCGRFLGTCYHPKGKTAHDYLTHISLSPTHARTHAHVQYMHTYAKKHLPTDTYILWQATCTPPGLGRFLGNQ